MTTRARVVAVAAATPVVLLVLLFAAWAIDSGGDDEVVRNVELAGRSVGGLSRADLAPVVDSVAQRYPNATVRIVTPDGDLSAPGADFGMALDREATIEAVLDVGRTGSVLTRPFGWVASLFSPREAPVVVTVDDVSVRAVLAERDPTERTPPTEPSITGVDGQVQVVPGAQGRGLVPAEVARAIPRAARDGEQTIVVEAEPGAIDPQFTVADAEAVAEQARNRAGTGLTVEAGGTAVDIPPDRLAPWFSAVPTPVGLELDVDEARVLDELPAILDGVGEEPVDAGFRVEGSSVVAVPGSSGTACCEEGAGQLVADALLGEPGGSVEVPLRTVEPERTLAEAQALGVREPIGSFTTNFAAGQSRVTNIHLMADLTRGVVIEPGATFSVNGHVGERTRAKGFASGGFINNGVLEEAIGGGVSQYATTLFNAAFFAGLDFVEYQSHSLYISRYPYGREATLSYPKPDLVIRNTTPHGVLIWPTYTASSITVTLYSTQYATGEQTGQSRSSAGNCTRVTTERTRTYVDGRTEVDNVFATYRPGEGVDC